MNTRSRSSGGKPSFVCEECEAVYQSIGALKRHQSMKGHGVSPLAASVPPSPHSSSAPASTPLVASRKRTIRLAETPDTSHLLSATVKRQHSLRSPSSPPVPPPLPSPSVSSPVRRSPVATPPSPAVPITARIPQPVESSLVHSQATQTQPPPRYYEQQAQHRRSMARQQQLQSYIDQQRMVQLQRQQQLQAQLAQHQQETYYASRMDVRQPFDPAIESARLISLWPLIKKKVTEDLRHQHMPTVKALSFLFPSHAYPGAITPRVSRSAVVMPTSPVESAGELECD